MGLLRGMRAQPEVPGSDVTGTGSDWKWEGHVIWDGKPLTSGKKGWRAQKREDMSCRGHDVPSG